AVEKVIWFIIAGAFFLAWRYMRGDVTLPVWLLVTFIGISLLLGFTARRGRQPSSQAASEIAELETQNALYGYYASFLSEALQTLQRSMRGGIPGVTLDSL